MTYILVQKRKDLDKKNLRKFLSNIFKKEISLDELETNPDIHNLEITEKLSIGIEDVKDFQKKLIYKPFQEDIQIGIIHDSQKLTHEAQNSLLKSLEESGDKTIYILSVDNHRNLLPTIRSRARIVYLQQEENNEEKDQESHTLKKDLVEQFEIVEKASATRELSIDFINDIEKILRKEFEIKIKNGSIEGSKKFLEDLKVLQKSREKLVSNCNRRLTLEAMIIQLRA
jgi:DNA polymerase III delta prime subunit